MAITFLQQKKRQKYLLIILGVLIAISLLVVWQMFFIKSALTPVEQVVKTPEVKMDFKTLENPIFAELTPFEKIPSFGDDTGRDNPFSPYK